MELTQNSSVALIYPYKDRARTRSTFYTTLVQRVFNVQPYDMNGSSTLPIKVCYLSTMEAAFVFEKQGYLDRISCNYVLQAMQRRKPLYVIRFTKYMNQDKAKLRVFEIKAIKLTNKTKTDERYGFIQSLEEVIPRVSETFASLLSN